MAKNQNPLIRTFPHQQHGVSFLVSRSAAGLFDEQGLGKSKQLIDAIGQCVDKDLLDGALIICPNHIKTTWQQEIAKHAPKKAAIVLGAGRKARRDALKNLRATFYIVNYEAVSCEIAVLRALLQFKKFALVLDESHRIKSPMARVTVAIHELRTYAARRYILTGTPVANKPDDLWSQIFFLDDGIRIGSTFDEFRRRYGDPKKGYSDLEGLQQNLAEIGLRRTKRTSLKLPPKKIVKIAAQLEPQQKLMYQEMRDQLRIYVETLTGEQIAEEADNILEKLLRLVQIASNPRLLDLGYSGVPGKFAVLDDIIRQHISESPKRKLIVWTSFVGNVELLKKKYSSLGAKALYGGVAGTRRLLAIDQFRNDPAVRILIATPAAAREGLTLTEADLAVYLDRTFNLVDYLQSQDRIHRIGQERPCRVMLLMAPDTIDEYVDFAIEQKLRIAEFVQSDSQAIDPMDALFQKPALISALLG